MSRRCADAPSSVALSNIARIGLSAVHVLVQEDLFKAYPEAFGEKDANKRHSQVPLGCT